MTLWTFDIAFAEPQRVQLIWVLLAGWLALEGLERARRARARALISTLMAARLIGRPPARSRRLSRLAQVLCGLLLVLAAMRPQGAARFEAQGGAGAEIMVLLDVSRSMLAEDVAPSRLERAKADLRDLLLPLRGNPVGLIAFAGRAAIACPVTPDHDFFRLVLDGLGPHSVGRGGTRIGEALRLALARSSAEANVSRLILLITDGEDQDSGPDEAAREAAARRIPIIAVGFGNEQGSPVPITDPRTLKRQNLRDARDQEVKSRLDGELLRRLALATGGVYIPAGTGALDIEGIAQAHLMPLAQRGSGEHGRLVRQEQYPWFILGAILLLVAAEAWRGHRSALRFPSARPVRAAALSLPLVLLSLAPLHADGQGPSPRQRYNEGCALGLAGKAQESEQALRQARERADDDLDLRRHAAYNLGCCLAARADEQGLDDSQRLARLREAADWFRAATQIEDALVKDARFNLEIVLRRILALQDQRNRRSGELEAVLERLIVTQRALLPPVQELVSQDPTSPETQALRDLAARQRVALADADDLARRVSDELAQLETAAQGQGPQEPGKAARRVQLANLQHYLQEARDRMGRGRVQLRLRLPERAHRRLSAALAALVRGREQLQDPVAVLDGLLGDQGSLRGETDALQRSRTPGTQNAPAPAWLTSPYLAEAQSELTSRVDELRLRLEAGARQLEGQPPAERSPRLAEALRAAPPELEAALGALEQARARLEDDRPAEALEPQSEALRRLAELRERFLDVRGLIELVYGGERLLAGWLADAGQVQTDLSPAVRKSQGRLSRLEAMLQEAPPELPKDADEQTRKSAAAEARRRELALGLARRAGDEMSVRDQVLADRARAVERTESLLKTLEELRQLFFSLVEHLRELGQRQQTLLDHTAADQRPRPELAGRQDELETRGRELAQALAAQVDHAQGPDQERLRGAAAALDAAWSAMRAASSALRDESAAPAAALDREEEAAEKIALALRLLLGDDPQDREDRQDHGDPQRQGEGQAAQAAKLGEGHLTPEQALRRLQGVQGQQQARQRERERKRRERQTYDTVEHDW